MVWDKSKPAATDLISDSQGDIQGNFQAVEEGDVPFERLECANTSPPATGKADSIYVYGKDANSKAELHARDEDNNEVQLTSAGKMGHTTTDVEMNSYTFDGTVTFAEQQQIACWRVFNDALSVNFGQGCTVTKNSVGNYTITFDANVVTTANYAVAGSGSSNVAVNASYNDTTSFTVITRSTTDSNAKDPGVCSIIVVGGQA